jgi:hypothetical protein
MLPYLMSPFGKDETRRVVLGIIQLSHTSMYIEQKLLRLVVNFVEIFLLMGF